MVDGSWLDGSTVLEATPTDNGEGVPKRVFLVITFSRGMPIPGGGSASILDLEIYNWSLAQLNGRSIVREEFNMQHLECNMQPLGAMSLWLPKGGGQVPSNG